MCVIFSICVCAVGSAMVSARGRADRIKTTKENDRYREKKSNIKKKDERPKATGGLQKQQTTFQRQAFEAEFT